MKPHSNIQQVALVRIKSAQECYNMVVATKTLEGIMPVGSKMGAKQMGTELSKR